MTIVMDTERAQQRLLELIYYELQFKLSLREEDVVEEDDRLIFVWDQDSDYPVHLVEIIVKMKEFPRDEYPILNEGCEEKSDDC